MRLPLGTTLLTCVALAAQARAQATRPMPMAHPPGKSHAGVLEEASAAAPDFISADATIAWIDAANSTVHVMRAGTNGFTCVLISPDPLGGPACADATGLAWLTALV